MEAKKFKIDDDKKFVIVEIEPPPENPYGYSNGCIIVKSVICPFCNMETREEYEGEGLVEYSYISKPMLWNCCYVFLDLDMNDMKYENFILKAIKIGEPNTFKVPLCKIISVVDRILSKYNCPRKLTNAEVIEVLGHKNDDHELDSWIVQKHNLIEYGYYEEPDKSTLFNMSLDVNKYRLDFDIDFPEIKNADFRHDGSVIWCLLENGETAGFSGD
jgi:hypothetical protein